jgi:hypothetical protein
MSADSTVPTDPLVQKFSVDNVSHIKYGLAYPVTYVFDIPAGVTDLEAYKWDNNWAQIPEKTANDLFSGIEAVRFDYTNNKAYVSVSFPSASDDVYIKITDRNGNTEYVTFENIATFYDNRRVAVVLTGDDWENKTNEHFENVCNICQARKLWFTPAIVTWGTDYNNVWYGNDNGPDWALIQQEVNEGFVEPAAHSRTHPPSMSLYDYDSEVGGCKQDIIENLTMPDLNRRGSQEYVYAWIDPHGLYDRTLQKKLGQYNYLCERTIKLGVKWFSSWNSTNGLYNGVGCTDGSFSKSAFDSVYSSGGIYHLYFHPWELDFTPGSYVYQHLDYISNRSDVWYVGFGHLYVYHYMQERGVITHTGGATRYQVKFDQTGLDNTATGTIVNVNGLQLTRDNLPYVIWAENGTIENYSYSSTVSSTIGGKQFKLNSVTGKPSPIIVTGPENITGNYMAQYKLTMATNFGTTSPSVGDYWYGEGAVVEISAIAPVASGEDQYIWNGWTGTGTISYTGTDNPATATMNSLITETASWTFIDVTPPPPPSLISPSNLALVRDTTPLLDWSDASDPSGVTYHLQVSRGKAFNQVVYEKSGIMLSQHELENPLQNGKYFWRVRAVDGAGNASDWSSTWQFKLMAIEPRPA